MHTMYVYFNMHIIRIHSAGVPGSTVFAAPIVGMLCTLPAIPVARLLRALSNDSKSGSILRNAGSYEL